MKKTEDIKNQKGITLVALVVTIVVLLILAGVSISMLNGENGIINQAKKAKSETEIGEEKEVISIAYSGAIAEDIGKKVTADDLRRELSENGHDTTNDVIVEDGSEIKVTFKGTTGNAYTINSAGKVEEYDSSTDVLEEPTEYAEVYDISENGDGSVKAYLVEREGESDKYDLLITGSGIMYTNYTGAYTQVPFNAFKDAIVTAKISSGITNIGRLICGGCTNLISVTIPDTVTSIGAHAFSDCTNLTSVIYKGTKEQWESITLEATWKLDMKATTVQCSDGTINLE